MVILLLHEVTTMTMSEDREQAIRLLESCRTELMASIEKGKEDLEAIQRSIQLLKGESHKFPVLARENAQQEDYSGMGPREAVMKYFLAHSEDALKPSVIARKLASMGYQRTNPNFNVFVTQVRTTCLRMVVKGVLIKTNLAGKTAFAMTKIPKQ